MSAFTQNAIRRVATLQVPRTLAASAPRAAFSTSVQLQKTVTEAAKDTLKTVDRKVSDKLVEGLNVASKVTEKVKAATEDVAGSPKHTGAAAELKGETKGTAHQAAGEAKGTAKEYAGEAKGKASKIAGEVKGKANEFTKDTSGTTSEVIGEAKGKASELAGEAKGKASELAGKAKGAAAQAQRKL